MTKLIHFIVSLSLVISLFMLTTQTSFARHYNHAGEIIATSIAVGVLTAFARPEPPPPLPPVYVPVYPSYPPPRPPYHYHPAHPLPPPPPPHRPHHRPHWR